MLALICSAYGTWKTREASWLAENTRMVNNLKRIEKAWFPFS
jgi:hypothetical protein